MTLARAGTVCACTLLSLALATPLAAESYCRPDARQDSGSIYRICMPPPDKYNGHLMIFAHGFQDATEVVGIPDDQLVLGSMTLPEIANNLGFGFATNSYSKTGLAVLQGVDDLLDLVTLYSAQEGPPEKVFLVGASEGGLITTLLVERHPEVFAGGLAACGPVGDFSMQLDYFGDTRVTFEYFFPGLIPGDPFAPDATLMKHWNAFYESFVRPEVFAPHNADALRQWLAVAKLPVEPDLPLETLENAVHDVLTYGVVNLNDSVDTLGGMPFDNKPRWYRGSDNDWQLNQHVLRVDAAPAAVTEMTRYDTTGNLQVPLITMHTRRDPVIPHNHEWLYAAKTLKHGALLRQHLHWPIDRFGHCNFTLPEGVIGVALLLFYTGDLGLLANLGDVLPAADQPEFDRLAEQHGLPVRAGGSITPAP